MKFNPEIKPDGGSFKQYENPTTSGKGVEVDSYALTPEELAKIKEAEGDPNAYEAALNDITEDPEVGELQI